MTDLLAEIEDGKTCFMTGGLSRASCLFLLLTREPLSVDVDLLIGGDGDLGLMELIDLSSARKGIFGTTSLSVNLEGTRGLLCFPEEQLRTCNLD